MVDRPSPNYNARRSPIQLIVVHADASPSESATLSWLASPKSQVSYHVLIGRDGLCYRIVPDNRRAWHAGQAAWGSVGDVNGVSLGVAVSNRQDGKEPITPAQFRVLTQVIAEWRTTYPTIQAVVTHKQCARPVGRKHDPDAAPNWLDNAHSVGVTL